MNKKQKDRLLQMACNSMSSSMPNMLLCSKDKLRHSIEKCFYKVSCANGYFFVVETNLNVPRTKGNSYEDFVEFMYLIAEMKFFIKDVSFKAEDDRPFHRIPLYFVKLIESARNIKPILYFKDLDTYSNSIQKLIQQLARSKSPYLNIVCTCKDINKVTKETLCCETNMWQHEWNVFDVDSLIKNA